MQLDQILPVALIAGLIYLIKIGVLSAVTVALGKLWKRLTRKDDE
jgi:Flp pilus assembly pilin Flp